jgi:integrase
VPLPPAAVDVLRGPRPNWSAGSSDRVFPAGRAGKPLSNISVNVLLRRMGSGGLPVHGFRSRFRDCCAETTIHPREAAQQALAHALTDTSRSRRLYAAHQRSFGRLPPTPLSGWKRLVSFTANSPGPPSASTATPPRRSSTVWMRR